jgi:putative salt-induced outer membrane protein YdiY
MNTLHVAQLFPALTCIIIIGSAPLSADTVDTKSGAHLIGKITKIDSDLVYLHTDYAGDIAIKQSEVASFATDQPVAVRLTSGTRLEGKVTPVNGKIQIAGHDGTLTTEVRHIDAAWEAGGEDPSIVALRRHWTYEAAIDVTGKNGNHNQLGTDGSFRADLKTPQDELQFYSEYNRQVTDGQKSADQLKVGSDYAAHFSERDSWYVRDEGGFDRVMDIAFYDVAAAGLGYDFIHQPKHVLTGRAGLSYRYDQYKDPATPTVSSLGGDFELNHEWTFRLSRLVNKLAFVPAFQNVNNFIIAHESYYEIPLADPAWKLRLGVSNDYNSQPGAGIKRLDTTYFTRLLLDWQ